MEGGGEASATLSTTLPPVSLETPLARGAALGRYLILEQLGSGAAGIVYSAYDPRLDRRVALKLLRETAPRSRARFLREMRALANLRHRNVVTLYDASEIEGRPFLAMELCTGGTLAAWCRAARRTTDDLLRTFLEAGEGLAAAHAAGFIHRDFKPANVLIAADGHPRVGDFGLVRAIEAAPAADDHPGPEEAAAPVVTGTGARVGTLAYMASEQLAGRAATAASDQFAYCVSLYEALFGCRPFAGDDAAALAIAIARGPQAPALRTRTERRVWRVLRRGLAAQPEARFPSMDALLGALRRARRGTAWRRLAAAVALSAVAAGSLTAATLRTDDPPCTGARTRLAGAWDVTRRERIAARFVASHRPYAADTSQRVVRQLDQYGDTWVAMHTEACRATRIDGDQSEHVLDLRMVCLDRRRAELAALADQLEHADDGVIEHAVTAATALSPVRDCGDLQGLVARAGRRAPTAADGVWQARLTAVKAQFDVGRWREGLAAAASLTADADAHADVPVRAEAWGWLGRLQAELTDAKTASRSLETALQLTAEAGDDVAAVHVVNDLVHAIGEVEGRYEHALVVADLGRAYVARAGNGDLLRAEQLDARGMVLGDLARYEEARAAFEEALALYAKHVPADDLNIGRVMVHLATNRDDAGMFAEASARLQVAFSIYEKQLGPEHPTIARLTNKLGIAADHLGHVSDALTTFRRALDLGVRAFGPDAVSVAHTHHNIANMLIRLGRPDEAVPSYERALAIYRSQLGPEHAFTASTMDSLGFARREQGRLDEALDLHRRALEIKLKANGADSPDVADTHISIGNVLLDRGDLSGAAQQYRLATAARSKTLGAGHRDTLAGRELLAEVLAEQSRCAEARPELQQILKLLESAFGSTSVELIDSLILLARCELDLGRRSAGMEIARRALAIAEPLAARRDLERPQRIHVLRFELARALWDTGDRARAVELAAGAEAGLTSPPARRDRQRVVNWRAAHAIAPATSRRTP